MKSILTPSFIRTLRVLVIAFLFASKISAAQADYVMTPDNTTTGQTATNYITSEKTFTFDGISWAINQWNPQTLQIKTNQASATSEFYCYNTSALPDNIAQVVLTFKDLTLSSQEASGWYLTSGTKKVGTNNLTTNNATQGEWDNNKKTLIFTVTGNAKYFTIWQNGAVASGYNYLATEKAIRIIYQSDGNSNQNTVTSIAINGSPSKTHYSYGESFDYSGLTTIATYSDGSEVDVTSSCQWANTLGEALTTEGTGQSVTVTASYKTFTATTTYTVDVDKTLYLDGFTDIITADNLAATSSTYKDFTNVTMTATYAGNTAKSATNAIQFRSSNSISGIVSTTSPGYIRKVIVTVNTQSDRTLDIYGKNGTAYSNAENLYKSSTAGKKLGSIPLNTTGTPIEFEVTGNYEYVGIRSTDGAIYLDEVRFVWDNVNTDYKRKKGASTWGTICMAKAATGTAGATFYEVSDKQETDGKLSAIVLSEVKTLEAGKPYLFRYHDGATAMGLVTNGEAVTAPQHANGLHGSFEGDDVSNVYLLSGDKFVNARTGHIGANRAYLLPNEINAVPTTQANARQFVFGIEGSVTGINEVLSGPSSTITYDLSGRRVNTVKRGIYINNGKKVVIR